MTVVTIHAAKTNLSRLIEQAHAGEEIIIARGTEPVARLVPMESRTPRREPGTLKGLVRIPPSFFDPLPEDELDGWGQ